ncbi:MAG: hypothetical protein Q4A34_04160 [Candidatus Saccharibacteria bacterium]|nr:hypothetical protein [Candidatus Saccharibacteria bacterium]
MLENYSPEVSEALERAFLAYGESPASTPAPNVRAPLAEQAINGPLSSEETSAVGDMITPSGEMPEQMAARVLAIGQKLAELRQSDFTLAA